MNPFFKTVAQRLSLDVLARGAFIVVTMMAARRLGLGPFGEFTYALALAQMFYPLTDMGTNLFLIKELGENRSRNDKIWVMYFHLRLALILATFALFLALLYIGRMWRHPAALTLGFVWMAGNSLMDLNQSICNGLTRLDLARTIVLIQRGFVITASVIALVYYPTPGNLLAAIAAASFVGITFSSAYLFRSLNASFFAQMDFKGWGTILKLATPNAISGMLGAWYLRVGFVLLAWYATAAQMGEYGASFRVLEAVYILPAAMMSMAVAHLAAARVTDLSHFAAEIRRIGLAMLTLGAAAATFIYFGSRLIVTKLFGFSFIGAVPVLKVLAGVSLMVFLNYFVTHLMVVINRQRRHALNEGIALLAAVVFSVYLVPQRAAVGAAMALLGTEVLLFILTTGTLWHRWQEA